MRGDVGHRVYGLREAEAPRAGGLPPFIAASRRDGVARVNFAVPTRLGLEAVRPEEWPPLRTTGQE
jgi:hypothetical protein